VSNKKNAHRLAKAKRIIVKIGSTLLVDAERGVVHRRWLESLAEDIARLRSREQEVVIVSSGAIAVGRRYLGLKSDDLKLEEKQAAAATGMVRLAHAYQEVLAHHSATLSQVLLTLEDTENRRRYINARNTLSAILRLGAIPLINENDTVATDEIRFGDNDRLAARVAAMVGADALVLLSDVAGLHTKDPATDASARLIEEVGEITSEIEAMAGDCLTNDGSGGMVTKLAAAKTAMAAGCSMVISDGKDLFPLKRIEEGAAVTWFVSSSSPKTARKRWIAGSLSAQGTLVVDDGAAAALRNGKSLLPTGVSEIEGDFQRGDAVVIRNVVGQEIGRGLCAYSAQDARRIMGHKSGEIEAILGYRGRAEMVHRDDLALA
jgi:glutamate 5-kinase